jgi:cysteinyl-tRNA synthetase
MIHQMEPEGRFRALDLLGLGGEFADPRMTKVDTTEIENAIQFRLAARKAKDWKEADRIRDELAAMGIALKDTKDPQTGEIVTTWEIAR